MSNGWSTSRPEQEECHVSAKRTSADRFDSRDLQKQFTQDGGIDRKRKTQMSISTDAKNQAWIVGKWFFKHEHFFGHVMGLENGVYIVRVPSYARIDTSCYVRPGKFWTYTATDFKGAAWFDSLEKLLADPDNHPFSEFWIFPEIPSGAKRLKECQADAVCAYRFEMGIPASVGAEMAHVDEAKKANDEQKLNLAIDRVVKAAHEAGYDGADFREWLESVKSKNNQKQGRVV